MEVIDVMIREEFDSYLEEEVIGRRNLKVKFQKLLSALGAERLATQMFIYYDKESLNDILTYIASMNSVSLDEPQVQEVAPQELGETHLTPGEESERERIAKGMKSSQNDLQKRYGDRWKEVMYATATKLAKEELEKELCDRGMEEGWQQGNILPSYHNSPLKYYKHKLVQAKEELRQLMTQGQQAYGPAVDKMIEDAKHWVAFWQEKLESLSRPQQKEPEQPVPQQQEPPRQDLIHDLTLEELLAQMVEEELASEIKGPQSKRDFDNAQQDWHARKQAEEAEEQKRKMRRLQSQQAQQAQGQGMRK